MGDTKVTAENGTEQRHLKEARRLAMQLRRRVWNGTTWEPEDKSVRILAAALAACAREAKLEEHDKLCLRCINAKTRPTLAVRCSRGIDLVAERAVGEKGK